MITVHYTDWEIDPDTGDWATGPIAFNVYGSVKGGYFVRIPGKVHPQYDTMKEAMYWSVWHMAGAMGDALSMLQQYDTAKTVWYEKVRRASEIPKPIKRRYLPA